MKCAKYKTNVTFFAEILKDKLGKSVSKIK